MNTESVVCEKKVDLNELARKMLEAAEMRKRNGANVDTDTIKMLKHCATEVVEATEAFTVIKCLANSEPYNALDYYEDFYSELADIMSCVLIICAKDGIDINDALQKCYRRNLARAEGKGEKK